jgi:hypothetical protein
MKLSVNIGTTRKRQFDATPTNRALLKAVKQMDATGVGRICGTDVAKLASKIAGKRITKKTAARFLAFLFEPQGADEALAMLKELR